MNRQSKKVMALSIAVLVAMVIAAASVSLPLFASELFDMDGITGGDLLKVYTGESTPSFAWDYPYMMILVANSLVASGLIVALINIFVKKRGMLIATLAMSVVAIVAMFLLMEDGLDAIGLGFVLFMVGNVAGIVCSIVGLVPAKDAVFPAVAAPYAPVAEPVAETAAIRCRTCGNMLREGVKFCNVCGTKVEEIPVAEPVVVSEPAPVVEPVAEPAPAPVVAPVAAPQKRCAKCGAELREGMRFCNVCGMNVASAPAPAPAAEPAPARSNHCRKCGAELMVGAKFCSICAAPVAEAAPAAPVKRVCTGCGAALQPGARFCIVCAKPVEIASGGLSGIPKTERRLVCPRCGARQSEENRFCRYCSTPLR